MSTFQNPGPIQIRQEFFSGTCVTDADLIANQMKYPAIRPLLEYVDKRMLTTLLTSGAITPYGVGFVPTKIGQVDASKKIGNNAYQFDVQGRIQKASTILSQVGASGADGSFTLIMNDRTLVEGMVALFYGNGFQARVMGQPAGSPGNYVYNFQSPDATVFSWTTHVSGQPGTKTCFGGHTEYGEGSLRGYGSSHFPETFIQHTTIQRKTTAITGDAASRVLWIDYEGSKGKSSWWMYAQLAQAKAQFAMEDEYQKWFGISTMKTSTGQLRTTPTLTDSNGLPIVAGDGVLAQISGGNELFGSGVNGEATYNDITDMMSLLEQKSDQVNNNSWVCVTGTDGYANAQLQMIGLNNSQGTTVFQQVNQTSAIGGAKVNIGYTYESFNVNGNMVTFVKHPMFDDAQRFPKRGVDGKLLQSSEMVFLNLGYEGRKNLEILSVGANGVDRSMVVGTINGMTGSAEMVLSEEDAKKYSMLMQQLIVIYNTGTCGIIHKSK